jgi:hypothetical protein
MQRRRNLRRIIVWIIIVFMVMFRQAVKDWSIVGQWNRDRGFALDQSVVSHHFGGFRIVWWGC